MKKEDINEEMDFEMLLSKSDVPIETACFEIVPPHVNLSTSSVPPAPSVDPRIGEEAKRRNEEALLREKEETLRREKEEMMRWERERMLQMQKEEALRRENEETLRREIETLRREKEEALRREKEETARREKEEALRREKEETLRRELEELQREKERASKRGTEGASHTERDDTQSGDVVNGANFTMRDDTVLPVKTDINTSDISTALAQLPQRRGDGRVKADEAAAFSLVEFALLTEEVLRKRKEEEGAGAAAGMGQKQSPPSAALSVVEFALIIFKGWYIILACAILAAFVGYMKVRKLPDVFTSSSYFVMNTSSGVEGLSRMSNPFGGSGKADPTDYLDKVIQDKVFLSTLYDRKWLHNGDSVRLETILGIGSGVPAADDDYFATMRKYDKIRYGGFISTYKDSKGIINLKTNANDPQFAYDLNLHVLDFLGNYMRGSIQHKAREKRIFVEDRMKEARRELDIAEGTLAKFRERNMHSSSPTILREEARLLRQVNVNQEIYTQLLKQLDIAKLEELDNVELVQIVRNPEIPRWRSSPNPPKTIMTAFFAGLFAGLVLVLVIHQFVQYRKYVKSQAEVTAPKI